MWSSAEATIGWLGVWEDVHADLKPLHDRQYTRLISDQFGADRHEYLRHQVLLHELGHEKEGGLRPGLWDMPPSRTSTTLIHELLNSGMYVVVVPGADAKIRRWPSSSFLELSNMIVSHFPKLKIVLLGTVEERQLDAVNGSAVFPGQVLDLRGKTALLDLSAIISGARLVIGNETGPIHLAIALDIPSVAIVGGGHYGRFMPYGEPRRHRTATNHLDCFHCNWSCFRNVPECIVDVRVGSVWKEVVDILETDGIPYA